MLTRCPHCQARFKVTDAHLNAAGGKVRCGNCMKVFNAKENLVQPSVHNTATAPAAARKTVTSPPSQPAARQTRGPAPHKPTRRLPDEDTRTIARPSAARATPTPSPPPSPAADPLTEALHEATGNTVDDDLENVLFQDDPEEDAKEAHYSGGAVLNDADLSEDFKALDGSTTDPSESFLSEVVDEETDTPETDNDESWAEEMLRELEDEPARPRIDPRAAAPQITAQHLDIEPAEPAPAFNHTGPAQTVRPEPPSVSPLSEDALMQLRQSHFQDEETDPAGGQWIWGLGSLLLVLVLLLQLAWLHFDRLARFDQLRPLYDRACNLLGCELPPLLDLKQIHNRNLAVRNHPTVQNALIVDAIIINDANFEQPFPNISLAFKDINDRVIAYRVFTPEEYLGGEARKMKAMPSRTPIHIALEILHPGKEAVNYELRFHPATYLSQPGG